MRIGWLQILTIGCSNFEIKDMDKTSFVLGVQIVTDCSERLFSLSQETHNKKVLKRFKM